MQSGKFSHIIRRLGILHHYKVYRCTGDVEKIVISLTRVNVILSLSLHVYAPREKKSRSDGDENRTGYMHTFQDVCVQECVD